MKNSRAESLLAPLEVEVPWPLGAKLPAWRFVVGFSGSSGLAPVMVSVERWTPLDLEDGGFGLSALALRRIPFGAVFAEARRRIPSELTQKLQGLKEQVLLTPAQWDAVVERAAALWRTSSTPTQRRGGQRPVPLEELAQAARVYGEALIAGEKPLRKVAKALKVSQSVASKRVYQARHRAGLLGPTRQGKAGGVAQTVVLDTAVRIRQAQPVKVSTTKKRGK